MYKSTFLGILAAIFFGLLPFISSHTLFYGQINSKYFFIVGFALILLVIFAYRLLTRGHSVSLKNRPLLILLGLTFVLYAVSAFLGLHPVKSLWSDIIRSSGIFFLSHVAIIAVILGEFLRERDFSLIRRSIAISSGIFALISFFSPEAMGFNGKILWINLSENGLTLGNSTFAGAYLLLSLGLAFVEISRMDKGSRMRKILITASGLMMASPYLLNIKLLSTSFPTIFSHPIQILGGARSASASMLLFLTYIFVYFLINKLTSQNFKKYILPVWNGLFTFVVVLAVTLLFVPGSFVQNKYIEESTGARVIVWESALKAIKERPYLGWGSENFREATQRHFDNRLYLDENIGEVWFDRAHNVIIDTLVDVGIVGLIIFLVLWGGFILKIRQAVKVGIIKNTEFIILSSLVVVYFLQLQTAFDTVATYTLLGFIIGYGLYLERTLSVKDINETKRNILKSQNGAILNKTLGTLFILLAMISFKFCLFDELQRQSALMKTFKETNSERQKKLAALSISRISSFESLRLSSNSFLKGALAEVINSKGDKNKIAQILSYIDLYGNQYSIYLKENPYDYRARMNYSNLLLIESALGRNRIDETKSIIGSSYILSPQNPLTYVLDSLAFLYGGNLKVSREKIIEGIALNPEIEFTKSVRDYIEVQAKKIPNISVLNLENL